MWLACREEFKSKTQTSRLIQNVQSNRTCIFNDLTFVGPPLDVERGFTCPGRVSQGEVDLSTMHELAWKELQFLVAYCRAVERAQHVLRRTSVQTQRTAHTFTLERSLRRSSLKTRMGNQDHWYESNWELSVFIARRQIRFLAAAGANMVSNIHWQDLKSQCQTEN